MHGYTEYTIKQIGTFEKSYSFSRASEGNGNFKHIHYGDIHTNLPAVINNSNILPPITEEGFFVTVGYGDILVADASEDYKDLGKAVCYLDETDTSVISGLHTIRIKFKKEKVVPEYLINVFQTNRYRKFVWRMGTGVSVLGLSKSNLANFPIFLPSLDVQKKVASYFIQLNKKIQLQQEKIYWLKEQKKGFMQKIFSLELRFKKNDHGSSFPNWEERYLNEVSDVRDGTHDSPKYYPSGYPLITSKNLNSNGTLNNNNLNYISKEDFEKVNKRSLVEDNDILFGMIGTIGNPVKVSHPNFAIKNVALIKDNSDNFNDFLIHFLNSSHIEKQFNLLLAGGTQKFIGLNDIRNLKVLVPCKEEQEKISQFLSLLDKKISLQEQILNSYKRQKRALIQQMFI